MSVDSSLLTIAWLGLILSSPLSTSIASQSQHNTRSRQHGGARD